MTDQIVLLNSPGDVAQFQVQDQRVHPPGNREIQIRHHAIGTNFLDVYHRKGIYSLPSYPAVIGAEAAGVVEAVGPGVENFKEGDHIAYAGPPVGAYCSTRNIAADRAIKLPKAISAKTAASSLLKGMTAYMLLTKTYNVHDGSCVLIHAAAGGLGSMLVRWAKSLNATVIGTVSSAEKAALAESYGADHLVVGRGADIVTEVKGLTGGNGVDVAFDGIGGDMLVKSIRSVRPFGMAVSIGQAAGPVPPVPLEELRPGKALSHPSIMAWCTDIDRYREAAQAAVRAMETGIVSQIGAEYSLRNVATAHEEMESGRSAGSILLVP
ncbi:MULTISPECIES: quinone oxidoreductase [unclassified Rhizobium]|uniref:quinone oxidoreductase family protein n=1 Tax=unclassified Rhizobium TaxID=2613769 RepID=UPI001A9973CE|nr:MULTISPECIES: quinone oxidoreductase [unclassified Rhizobium]MBX5195093.1 quinone oxidoreductase [Rhizobium sp. NZLR10]MBX5203196.1 quinone oxidoreductase [Rhizobium sp. NZLR1]QSZ19568.1 quinone oxidoreductase [Rhizobium sp. NZLR1]